MSSVAFVATMLTLPALLEVEVDDDEDRATELDVEVEGVLVVVDVLVALALLNSTKAAAAAMTKTMTRTIAIRIGAIPEDRREKRTFDYGIGIRYTYRGIFPSSVVHLVAAPGISKRESLVTQ